jgi:hypothetical protein
LKGRRERIDRLVGDNDMTAIPCQHVKLRSIVILLQPTHLRSPRRAVLTICCEECSSPFEFLINEKYVELSEDRRRWLSIIEASQLMVQ